MQGPKFNPHCRSWGREHDIIGNDAVYNWGHMGVTLPVLHEEAQGLQKNATQRLLGPGDLHRAHERPYLKGDGKMKIKPRESLGVRELKQNLRRTKLTSEQGSVSGRLR